MTDQETADRVEELMQKYKYIWGREIEMSFMPPGMTKEKFVVVLERITETGESVLVGWKKCFPER
ncbi:MAG: hypothetical protein K2N94_03655 [Lachnospiraceae bacterium]|nr:hypothetical protein [Lachnospiraceae bacterium]